ncbi:MAG: hypothetical protein EZS28_037045, partial [Streblomastix strix]
IFDITAPPTTSFKGAILVKFDINTPRMGQISTLEITFLELDITQISTIQFCIRQFGVNKGTIDQSRSGQLDSFKPGNIIEKAVLKDQCQRRKANQYDISQRRWHCKVYRQNGYFDNHNQRKLCWLDPHVPG